MAINYAKLVTLNFFEITILISNLLDFKQHQCRGPRNKLKRALRKRQIQRAFRAKLHIRIDMPRDSGHGTTNDGNTARKFFENPKIVSKILNVPEDLVRGIAKIWTTLKSGHMIDPEDFGKQCDDWVKKYKASHISWYKLSPSVHKVVKHGKAIIEYFPVPVAWLSEEPSGLKISHCQNCSNRS